MAKLTSHDTKNQLSLRIVHDALQAKMLAYYNAGTTKAERARRAAQITDKLKAIKFKDGAQTFTIAAKTSPSGSTVVKCGPEEHDCDGTCVPLIQSCP
jgi:hypothetical protein